MNFMNQLDKLYKVEIAMTFSDEEEEMCPVLAELKKMRAQTRVVGPIVEHVLHFENTYWKNLFVAICKRFELKPFRYSNQKPTTMVVHVSDTLMTEELWPSFKRCERICNEFKEQFIHNITCQIHEIEKDDVREA